MLPAPIAREIPAPVRSTPPSRRPAAPWGPETAGPYRLPRDVQERLTAALAGFRNREAAFALAVFLGRYWSTPARLALKFPVDRRGLADHRDLGLSEHQVRAARDTLETIGFLEREEQPLGHRYQRTAEGPQRKPILFRFGADYAPDFTKANARAQAARGARSAARRPIIPATLPCPSVALLHGSSSAPSHKQSQAKAIVIMGGQTEQRGFREIASCGLGSALGRLAVAMGLQPK